MSLVAANERHSGKCVVSVSVLGLLVFFCMPSRRHNWRVLATLLITLSTLSALTACAKIPGRRWRRPSGLGYHARRLHVHDHGKRQPASPVGSEHDLYCHGAVEETEGVDIRARGAVFQWRAGLHLNGMGSGAANQNSKQGESNNLALAGKVSVRCRFTAQARCLRWPGAHCRLTSPAGVLPLACRLSPLTSPGRQARCVQHS